MKFDFRNSVLSVVSLSVASLSLALGLIGCSHKEVNGDDIEGTGPEKTWSLNEKTLRQDVALMRAERLSNLKYNLDIHLNTDEHRYKGSQTIAFDLKSLDKDIPLEFEDGEIEELTINGKPMPKDKGPLFILLPKENLILGPNEIKIVFAGGYSRNGSGLHRFQDPQDKQIYMYTDFEPYDAHRWAPFFDQPDLKGILALRVTAPKHWEVIGNSPVRQKITEGPMTRWEFRTTPVMSTYLFAMIAGPYVKWTDKYKKIPLGLYVRKSLARYVNPKVWFTTTKNGLKFYENYFGINYPYEKYDQLIVPEFNSGAMENLGAVTFTERVVNRGVSTQTDDFRRNSIILHEMAHMWFGDLVTMKWWNDLWLNESFATFMSATALPVATQLKDSWVNFRSEKESAYWQDDLVITHPISGVVRNTNEAHTNFDSITYDKGAAVMKELNKYVGEEDFRKALRYYFEKNAYKNTTIDDFIAAFEVILQKPIRPWFTTWLETTGTDSISTSFECQPGKSFTINLSLVGGAERLHSFDVAPFKLKNDKVVLIGEPHSHYLESNKKSSLSEASEDTECPDFVYPNYNDYAYMKVNLDPQSIEFLQAHINQIQDPLLRMSVWNDLWEMVLDQKIKIDVFSKMALQGLATEKDLDILQTIAEKTFGYKRRDVARFGDFDSLYYFIPKQTDAEKQSFLRVAAGFEKVVGDRYRNEKKNTDLKNTLFDIYLFSVQTEDGVNQVKELLAKTTDTERRWHALQVLCREDPKASDQLLKEELQKDSSDAGQKQALACEALNPSEESKGEWIKKLLGKETTLSADETSRIAYNLFPPTQRALIAKYADDIYNSLHAHWLSRDEVYQSHLALGLAPVYCDKAANEKLGRVLKTDSKLPATLKKPLLERWEEDRKCIGVRNYNYAN